LPEIKVLVLSKIGCEYQQHFSKHNKWCSFMFSFCKMLTRQKNTIIISKANMLTC